MTIRTVEPRSIALRDGTPAVLRPATLDDAHNALRFRREVLPRCPYVLTSKEDVEHATLAESIEWITTPLTAPPALRLIADVAGVYAGALSVDGGRRAKIRHRALLGMAIDEPYRGKGLGRALMNAAIDWARAEPTITRLWLEVIPDNTAALNLYTSLGFVECGREPNAFILPDGSAADDARMILDL